MIELLNVFLIKNLFVLIPWYALLLLLTQTCEYFFA